MSESAAAGGSQPRPSMVQVSQPQSLQSSTTSSPSQRCLIAKHVSPSELIISPAQAHAKYIQRNGGSPAPGGDLSGTANGLNPGGLSTLLEASHSNALHKLADTSGERSEGMSIDMEGALAGLTPTQRSLAIARADGYDTVLVEMPNERWRQRWERLCLSASAGASDSSKGGYASAASGPQSNGTSVPKSSSRKALSGPTQAQDSVTDALAREAELWRAAPSFNRGELNVTRLDETDGLVVVISPWLELDALDEGVRLDSELALRQELAFAAYLGIAHAVLPAPSSDPRRRPFLADYARAVNGCLTRGTPSQTPAAGHWMSLSIRMPISSPRGLSLSGSSTVNSATALTRTDDDWAWEAWEKIRHACSYTSRLQLVLDLSFPLTQPAALSRWVAEPISSIWLAASSFLANAKGYPVLSKAMQAFLRSLLARSPTFVLFGVDTPPPQHTRGGPAAYLQYMRHLERTAPPDGPVAVFGKGYGDWLQAPLQPLMDNLEGGTYEVFERDPVKYALYEEAVYRALRDRDASAPPAKIWVCGAGRGPLVSRCLIAAERAQRKVELTALEKNPNAFVTLQEKQALEWGSERVQLRFGDMRTYPVPPDAEKPHIVVSELLGSFGDNELSPECLDGAMRFLRPDGISIPSSYTSYLTPLASAKLHHEVTNTSSGSEHAVQKACETPYVVLFQAALQLAGDSPSSGGEDDEPNEQRHAVQATWTFEHSVAQHEQLVRDPTTQLPITNAHNVRSAHHTFHIPHAGTCHGLAGYFEAILYADVCLSIHPDPKRHSKDMLSWFPIFFPFRNPLYLPASSSLDVHIWRLCSDSDKRVWYEWSAESYLSLPTSSSPSNAASALAHAPASAHDPQQPPPTAAAAAMQHQRRKTGSPAPSYISGSSAAPESQSAAFASAPGTPVLGPSLERSGSAARRSGGGGATRVKTGMSALMNPRGRSSWIGL